MGGGVDEGQSRSRDIAKGKRVISNMHVFCFVGGVVFCVLCFVFEGCVVSEMVEVQKDSVDLQC